MKELLRPIIQSTCQLDPRLPILVGISGGPDSLFLLDVLHLLNYKLVVAHLDHQLRPESNAEAKNVSQIASSLGLPVVVERLDVHTYAARHKLSIEEAARQARYKFLFKQAEACLAQAVAVGHTADDQVETVLLHFLRGAGLSGLSGMTYRSLPNAWSTTIPLVRPILSVWRTDILKYLAEKSYAPHWDSSNLDTAFLRNRLRHELIPYLEQFNPRLRQNMWQMANILHHDEVVLQQVVNQLWQTCYRGGGEGYCILDISNLIKQPIAIRRRLIRTALETLLPGLPNIEFKHIQKVIQFLDQPTTSAHSDLAAGYQMFTEQNNLYLASWEAEIPVGRWPQITTDIGIQLQVPGETFLSDKWKIIATLQRNNPKLISQAQSNQNLFQAWLNFDQGQTPLIVRNRQPGDRFQPFGMHGQSQKLSDYFINQKLAQRARQAWPLIIIDGQIAWIPGFQIGDSFRLTSGAKNILQLELQQI